MIRLNFDNKLIDYRKNSGQFHLWMDSGLINTKFPWPFQAFQEGKNRFASKVV